MAGRLGARRRLAGAQQHRHRPPRRRVVDMDRQEAALTMMPVPEGQLLIAVNDITGVIDIQRHRLGRGRIAGAVDVDHRPHHAGQLACGRRIFPPAHRWLAGKPRARSRQLAQRQAEARIVTQRVEIIGVLVAAAIANTRARRMSSSVWITRAGSRGSAMQAASRAQIPIARSACASSRTPPSDVSRPPSNAAVTFLRPTAGNEIGARYHRIPGGCGLWHSLPRCRLV
jgi:hypothetical protein